MVNHDHKRLIDDLRERVASLEVQFTIDPTPERVVTLERVMERHEDNVCTVIERTDNIEVKVFTAIERTETIDEKVSFLSKMLDDAIERIAALEYRAAEEAEEAARNRADAHFLARLLDTFMLVYEKQQEIGDEEFNQLLGRLRSMFARMSTPVHMVGSA